MWTHIRRKTDHQLQEFNFFDVCDHLRAECASDVNVACVAKFISMRRDAINYIFDSAYSVC